MIVTTSVGEVLEYGHWLNDDGSPMATEWVEVKFPGKFQSSLRRMSIAKGISKRPAVGDRVQLEAEVEQRRHAADRWQVVGFISAPPESLNSKPKPAASAVTA